MPAALLTAFKEVDVGNPLFEVMRTSEDVKWLLVLVASAREDEMEAISELMLP